MIVFFFSLDEIVCFCRYATKLSYQIPFGVDFINRSSSSYMINSVQYDLHLIYVLLHYSTINPIHFEWQRIFLS